MNNKIIKINFYLAIGFIPRMLIGKIVQFLKGADLHS